MKRARVLGFEVTLNCIRCGKECFMLPEPFEVAGRQVMRAINKTYVEHQTVGCSPAQKAEVSGNIILDEGEKK